MKTMDDNTLKLLQPLAEKLGTNIEHLWSVLVKQAYVDSITYSTTLIASAIILYAAFIQARKLDEDTEPLAQTVIVLFVFAWFITFSLVISDTVSGFINPEYIALKLVLNHGS